MQSELQGLLFDFATAQGVGATLLGILLSTVDHRRNGLESPIEAMPSGRNSPLWRRRAGKNMTVYDRARFGHSHGPRMPALVARISSSSVAVELEDCRGSNIVAVVGNSRHITSVRTISSLKLHTLSASREPGQSLFPGPELNEMSSFRESLAGSHRSRSSGEPCFPGPAWQTTL